MLQVTHKQVNKHLGIIKWAEQTMPVFMAHTHTLNKNIRSLNSNYFHDSTEKYRGHILFISNDTLASLHTTLSHFYDIQVSCISPMI